MNLTFAEYSLAAFLFVLLIWSQLNTMPIQLMTKALGL